MLERILRTRTLAQESHESWPTESWTVAGKPLQASVFRTDTAWTGFVGLDDVAIIAGGRAVEPTQLRFAETDGRDYHADLRAPHRFPQDLETARREALGS